MSITISKRISINNRTPRRKIGIKNNKTLKCIVAKKYLNRL